MQRTPTKPSLANRRGLLRNWTFRRGAVSVMAMIMLVLFGSLVSAMAIASKGNIRTSATHLHVYRARAAAETGLGMAAQRLAQASSRFMIASSTVDSTFGQDFWNGNLGSYGAETPLPPPTGHAETGNPAGLAEALFNMHAADVNVVAGFDLPVLELRNAPANADLTVYAATNWLVTPPIALSGQGGNSRDAFQVTYAPLANGVDIRVIVTGYDFGYSSTRIRRDFDGSAVTDQDGETQNQNYITRIVTQDFRIAKTVNNAIISPSKIMIGKNVRVEGDIGARFSGTSFNNGDPVILASDFESLDATLDSALGILETALQNYDVDGDNRLRVSHPIEQQGIPLTDCYKTVSEACGGTETDDEKMMRSDVTGDGYYDAFDVFIRRYDTPTSGPDLDAYDDRIDIAAEFIDAFGNVVDEDLARLIDTANPDRNDNGSFGFFDDNGNGKFDGSAGETLVDVAANPSGVGVYYPDLNLGYLDGYLDFMDEFSKIDGSLAFTVNQADWANADAALNGAIDGGDDAPVTFGADTTEVPNLTAASFAAAATNLAAASDGQSFWQQVGDQLGVAADSLDPFSPSFSPYGETKPFVSYDPMSSSKPPARYLRIDRDFDFDGLPDNFADAYVHFEKMPYDSPNFSDWYYRPVFQNMVFKDVEIPAGLNALFENCTFVGVTRVRSFANNTHPFWNQYGKLTFDTDQNRPVPQYEREIYGDEPGEDASDMYAPVAAYLNPAGQFLLRCITQTLDKGDLLQSEVTTANQADFDALPEPILYAGRRIVDTKELSNNLRFHDCLIVGSIVSDAVNEFTHVRNKVQFTGVTRFTQVHPDEPNNTALNPEESDVDLIARSSLMFPNYSVDIGRFNSPANQNVNLQGAIIAGVLDVRGNADIHGALLLTFEPILGQGPLKDYLNNPVGNPANFNTTLGYFGPADGDEESLDPQSLPVNGNGDRIVGWDTDGDGLPDVSGTEAQPAGSAPVFFEGYGMITLRFDPDMILPDGIVVPMSVRSQPATYAEGSY